MRLAQVPQEEEALMMEDQQRRQFQDIRC